MSASEKLRELVDSYGWPPQGLKEALPELIAVVEAAERLPYESSPGVPEVNKALRALKEKLR